MQRSEIREIPRDTTPDFVALHPGYGAYISDEWFSRQGAKHTKVLLLSNEKSPVFSALSAPLREKTTVIFVLAETHGKQRSSMETPTNTWRALRLGES